MSTICMENPNSFKYSKGNQVDECRIENSVSITQNMFNFNNLSNSLDSETINALPFSYEQNEQYMKLREQQQLKQQQSRDQKPNQMQFDMNAKFDQMVRDFQSRIVKLEEFYERKINEILKNNRADREEPRKIEPFTVNKPTFNNDQFNELLLYIFTGIFLLVLIDYIYKLGKKSF